MAASAGKVIFYHYYISVILSVNSFGTACAHVDSISSNRTCYHV